MLILADPASNTTYGHEHGRFITTDGLLTVTWFRVPADCSIGNHQLLLGGWFEMKDPKPVTMEVAGITEFDDPALIARIDELEDLADGEAEKRASLRRGAQFHRDLANARLHAGLTQSEVAHRIGTTQSAIARLESGAVTPTVDMLSRLADAIEVVFEVKPKTGLMVHSARKSARS